MQQCELCKKEVSPDMFFCAWCGNYLGCVGNGKKANLFARWVACAIDPAIGFVAWLIPTMLLTAISGKLAMLFSILFAIAYFVWFLFLLQQGLTPGKLLLGLRVVDQRTGDLPGFGKMFLREIVGKTLSGLFFGLGYFWAIFDKNAQAWHDKLAGTVVVKRPSGEPVAVLPTA
jgi:uncharacterized RDD family membrane protein YckC